MMYIPYTVEVDGTLVYPNPSGAHERIHASSWDYTEFIMGIMTGANLPIYVHPALWHGAICAFEVKPK